MRRTRGVVHGFTAPHVSDEQLSQYRERHNQTAQQQQQQQGTAMASVEMPDELVEYWRRLEQRYTHDLKAEEARRKALLASTALPTGDPGDTQTMDLEEPDEEDDDDDVSLRNNKGGSSQGPTGKEKTTIYMLFGSKMAELGAVAGGSPAGVTSPSGGMFRLCAPTQVAPVISRRVVDDWLPDVSAVRNVATSRYGGPASAMVAAINVLPSMVHVSPLALMLTRAYAPVGRFTDAISSLVQLYILYFILKEMDTDGAGDPAMVSHRLKCGKYAEMLTRLAEKRWRGAISTATAASKQPTSDKRALYANILQTQFGPAVDLYALARINILEWLILDIRRVPYSLRHVYMTPPIFPPSPEAAFAQGNQQGLAILRDNLCKYTRNRQTIFCSRYETNLVTGAVVNLGPDPNAFNPMQLDNPRIEDRLRLLGKWEGRDSNAQLSPEQVKRCLFGLYKGWIDLHTLLEWVLFLSTEPRPSSSGQTTSSLGQKGKP